MYGLLAIFISLLPVALVILGSYMLRWLLPKDHPLQSFVTEEAIGVRYEYMMRNRGKILTALVGLYFIVVTVMYS